MRRRFALALSAGFITGCGALIGLSDLDRVACIGDGCVAPGESGIDPETGQPFVDGGTDAPSGEEGGLVTPDGGDGGDTGPKLPSVCNGLAMWISFDGASYVAKPGNVTPQVAGSGIATYNNPGKYGQRALALGEATGPTQLTYDVPFNWRDQGTVSMWIDGNFGTSCGNADRTFFYSGASTNLGPRLRCSSSAAAMQVAFQASAGGESYAYSQNINQAGGWSTSSYNFVAVAWAQTQNVRVTLNAMTFDSQTGTYNATTLGGKLIVGDTIEKPDGSFDDIAVWSRQLSQAEVDAVRSAGKSVGEICGL